MNKTTPIASLVQSADKPALDALGRELWSRARYSPSRFCRMRYWESVWSMRLKGPSAKPLNPLLAALGPNLDRQRLLQVSIRYRTFRKYMKFLLRHWTGRKLAARVPFAIAGRTHLQEALRKGKGAVLIAPHNYGFSRFTVPILVRCGYTCARVGTDSPDKINECWGDLEQRSWEYVHVEREPLLRIRALRRLKQLLARNTVVHLLVPNRRAGDAHTPVHLCGHTFYLQAATFNLLAELDSAVLPCFTLCDNQGRLLINIEARLPKPSSDAAKSFAATYNHHLRDLPEFVSFWESLIGDAESW